MCMVYILRLLCMVGRLCWVGKGKTIDLYYGFLEGRICGLIKGVKLWCIFGCQISKIRLI